MDVVVQIQGRDALPVRAVPFAGRWQWMSSPDGIASACSQKSEGSKWIKVHQDADPQEVVVRNREFLPAFAISGDGAVRALHPDEWSFCIDEINCLGTKLKGEEAAEGENLSTWRRQAIEKLPAGAFVWLDDFKRWLADNACSDIDEQILDDDPVVEPTLQPLVPSDLETVLFEGFRAAKPQDWSATSSFSSLTSILAGWFETPADDLPSEQWYRIRTASWLMLWDKLSPSQRREVALQWDYLHDPSNAVEREQALEAFCQLDQIRKEIREWGCLNPQSITEKAEQTDRLRALREQAQLLDTQLSGDVVHASRGESALLQGDAVSAEDVAATPAGVEPAEEQPHDDRTSPSLTPMKRKAIISTLGRQYPSLESDFNRSEEWVKACNTGNRGEYYLEKIKEGCVRKWGLTNHLDQLGLTRKHILR